MHACAHTYIHTYTHILTHAHARVHAACVCVNDALTNAYLCAHARTHDTNMQRSCTLTKSCKHTRTHTQPLSDHLGSPLVFLIANTNCCTHAHGNAVVSSPCVGWVVGMVEVFWCHRFNLPNTPTHTLLHTCAVMQTHTHTRTHAHTAVETPTPLFKRTPTHI